MKRAKPISIRVLLAGCILGCLGCGSTLRDVFYSSRQPGYAPARDTEASATLFSSAEHHREP